MPRLLASSNSLEGIKSCISKFYCGATITIEGEAVSNAKGVIPTVRVVKKAGRYRFETV